MRDWRREHPLTEDQRLKDRARSYANVYKQRGYLQAQDCLSCGKSKLFTQMHHPDYQKPLAVIWLCRPCHRRWHRERLEPAFDI